MVVGDEKGRGGVNEDNFSKTGGWYLGMEKRTKRGREILNHEIKGVRIYIHEERGSRREIEIKLG